MKRREHVRDTLRILLCTAVICLQSWNCRTGAAADDLTKLTKPLPTLKQDGTALSYHEIPIDLNDPHNQDPLVNLANYGISGESFYARKDGLNAPYRRCICPEDSALRLRKTVAEKLKKVNAHLASAGLELYVFDAYRPVSCQKKLWDYFLVESRRMLGQAAPQHALIEYAGKFCSDPTTYDPNNYKTWSTHLTGSAVDLTLRRKQTGELLFMGGIFDDAADLTITRYFEDANKSKNDRHDSKNEPGTPAASASSIEAMNNRRILYWAMNAEDFANYPNEWWHSTLR